MKIATWNIERLKHKRKMEEITAACKRAKADILILTEADTQIQLDYQYCFQTPSLTEIEPKLYRATENRVSIFTNYKCVKQHTTYNKYTAICVELKTESGNLLVYGTIIGVYGNRHPSFQQDLSGQMADWKRLSDAGIASVFAVTSIVAFRITITTPNLDEKQYSRPFQKIRLSC